MKRALVITVAGRSVRFGRSLGREVFKILYYEGRPDECLLSQQLALVGDCGFEQIVIVGGYAFSDLREFIERNHGADPRINLVFNERYHDHGTCYSLACGLKALESSDVDEIVFMEGDLIFDEESFRAVVECTSDVITANHKLIRADESVVFYVTTSGRLCYQYDTEHKALEIKSPFTVLGNSGQVWKFCAPWLLHESMRAIGGGLVDETNLLPIERYFNDGRLSSCTFISFHDWFNCNTIDDYRAIRRYADGKARGKCTR